jgi:hypothetical protein
MVTQAKVFDHPVRERQIDMSKVYQEGIVAGVLGAGTIALWFLIIDTIQGRPLYTPTVLGTAFFGGGDGLESPRTLAPAAQMVMVFTWVHFLAFAVMGGIASRLLAVAERRPNFAFGIILLFVVFGCVFIGAVLTIESRILDAIGWVSIVVGNLFAAVVMGGYFWRRHPDLEIAP